MGGHLVQGHVDTVGRVVGAITKGGARIIEIRFDPSYGRYVINEGSVAVDGISLTVKEACASSFKIAVIPETIRQTTLSTMKTGKAVNVEFDVIAKYVESMTKQRR
jgi:riboflavin synthase